MKYLVTGGAGFIGSNIVKRLLEDGNEVAVLDNFATGKRENLLAIKKNLEFRMYNVECESSAENSEQGTGKENVELKEEPPRKDDVQCTMYDVELKKKKGVHELHELARKERGKLEIIEGDLRSFHIVRSAVQGVDYVLHQGALPSVPRSINDPITSNDVNILGMLNILEAAKEFGVKRVVLASSSSIYGNSETLPKEESMPVNPMSPYALTKYAQERYCQIFYELYGLETVSLRYFNVFGPNQDPTSQYSAVIPKFIKAIANNIQPIIYGDGSQSRDFTFVENNVEANLLACTAEKAAGEVINVACGERFTLIELVEMINKILGKNVEPKFEKERAGDVKHSLASIDKAKRVLKYEVKVDFEEGLRRTVEFFIHK